MTDRRFRSDPTVNHVPGTHRTGDPLPIYVPLAEPGLPDPDDPMKPYASRSDEVILQMVSRLMSSSSVTHGPVVSWEHIGWCIRCPVHGTIIDLRSVFPSAVHGLSDVI